MNELKKHLKKSKTHTNACEDCLLDFHHESAAQVCTVSCFPFPRFIHPPSQSQNHRLVHSGPSPTSSKTTTSAPTSAPTSIPAPPASSSSLGSSTAAVRPYNPLFCRHCSIQFSSYPELRKVMFCISRSRGFHSCIVQHVASGLSSLPSDEPFGGLFSMRVVQDRLHRPSSVETACL